MRRARLVAARIAGIAILLTVGVGASAALADPGNGNGPPTTAPGSPGDDCSHGNADKDCRPDPNENGKDCEDHGNARGNEDHCDQSTGTTTTTTTNNTTTTNSTTTNSTTTNSTTTTPKNTTPGTTSSPSSTTGTTTSTPNPPVTQPQLDKELAKQAAKSGVAGAARAESKPGELPFTGFPTWIVGVIGGMLLAAGLGLRRVTS